LKFDGWYTWNEMNNVNQAEKKILVWNVNTLESQEIVTWIVVCMPVANKVRTMLEPLESDKCNKSIEAFFHFQILITN
jgi:hypothetical protein